MPTDGKITPGVISEPVQPDCESLFTRFGLPSVSSRMIRGRSLFVAVVSTPDLTPFEPTLKQPTCRKQAGQQKR